MTTATPVRMNRQPLIKLLSVLKPIAKGVKPILGSVRLRYDQEGGIELAATT